ncbi:hypothetical protein EEL32_09195 [Brevibacillus laterosporus]|uniref:Uncharacterized protein n=1 Tax=Brevibacillus laterosporus TaxID=1465 RepID=A0A502IRV6_BRELA|nr:hypothetical protein [Brevibacillus laterosporus]QDX93373.1 hypothetical protein EEL30_14350 [Brevibacillus laterosporus]RAP30347.1 hypothetical protein C2W64_01539 [Brevibacillus laterosporus]TPG73116.1 hypothetical protein EEL31_01685 [Brevibacillus laterosporus]TPG88328.1 hypothetical protein EEL32_09195 [Brevibacillus laterosporus]
MDFSQLRQYFNDITHSIGDIGSKTGNALFGIQSEINKLNQTLHTTNILLSILIILVVVHFIYSVVQVQNRKKNK